MVCGGSEVGQGVERDQATGKTRTPVAMIRSTCLALKSSISRPGMATSTNWLTSALFCSHNGKHDRAGKMCTGTMGRIKEQAFGNQSIGWSKFSDQVQRKPGETFGRLLYNRAHEKML